MKFTKLWEQYQSYTRDFTENARSLGFAAGGICWLFKSPQAVVFPPAILTALAFLVGFFICDMFQSICGSIILRRYNRSIEIDYHRRGEAITENTVIQHSPDVDRVVFRLYLAKASFLFCSFAMIVLGIGIQLFEKTQIGR